MYRIRHYDISIETSPDRKKKDCFQPKRIAGNVQLLSVDCIRRYSIFIFFRFSPIAFTLFHFPFILSSCMCVSMYFYLSHRVKCSFNGVRFLFRIIELMWGILLACLPNSVSLFRFSISLRFVSFSEHSSSLHFRQFCDKHAMASFKMSLRLRYITRV